MDLRIYIGQRIKEIREAKGLTQAELAEKAGIIRSNLTRIESGKYSTGIDIVGKIAEVLDCHLEIEAPEIDYSKISNKTLIEESLRIANCWRENKGVAWVDTGLDINMSKDHYLLAQAILASRYIKYDCGAYDITSFFQQGPICSQLNLTVNLLNSFERGIACRYILTEPVDYIRDMFFMLDQQLRVYRDKNKHQRTFSIAITTPFAASNKNFYMVKDVLSRFNQHGYILRNRLVSFKKEKAYLYTHIFELDLSDY